MLSWRSRARNGICILSAAEGLGDSGVRGVIARRPSEERAYAAGVFVARRYEEDAVVVVMVQVVR